VLCISLSKSPISSHLFLAARVVQTQNTAATLDGAWFLPAVVAVFATLFVVGVSAVPGFRGLRAGTSSRKLREFGWTAALLLAGAGGVILAVGFTGLSPAQLIAAPAAKAPPAWVLAAVVSLFLGVPLAAIPAAIRGPYDSLVTKSWGGRAALIPAAVAILPLAYYSVDPLADAVGGAWPRTATALLGLGGAPVVAAVYLFLRRR
jgi:hypothetical protein